MEIMGRESKRGFCIFINTMCQGAIPVERYGDTGFPVVYPTQHVAEREVAGDVIDRLNEFLEGERAFDDAINPEEYVAEVTVFPDGSIVDDAGCRFGNEDCYEGK